jgi:hypothetical protein
LIFLKKINIPRLLKVHSISENAIKLPLKVCTMLTGPGTKPKEVSNPAVLHSNANEAQPDS